MELKLHLHEPTDELYLYITGLEVNYDISNTTVLEIS